LLRARYAASLALVKIPDHVVITKGRPGEGRARVVDGRRRRGNKEKERLLRNMMNYVITLNVSTIAVEGSTGLYSREPFQ
jgi:hypothetical protein